MKCYSFIVITIMCTQTIISMNEKTPLLTQKEIHPTHPNNSEKYLQKAIRILKSLNYMIGAKSLYNAIQKANTNSGKKDIAQTYLNQYEKRAAYSKSQLLKIGKDGKLYPHTNHELDPVITALRKYLEELNK